MFATVLSASHRAIATPINPHDRFVFYGYRVTARYVETYQDGDEVLIQYHEMPLGFSIANKATGIRSQIPIPHGHLPLYNAAYGGYFKGVHLYIAREIHGKRTGFAFLDVKNMTYRFAENKGYREAYFDKEGRIRAWCDADDTKLDFLSNDGARVINTVKLPSTYRGVYLAKGTDRWHFTPDYIYFWALDRARFCDLIVFDPQAERVVATITGWRSISTKTDFTSVVRHATATPGAPCITVHRLEHPHVVYAMVVALSDKYFKLKPKSKISRADGLNARRFFDILARLPLELQMLTCNKLGDHKDFITAQQLDFVLPTVLTPSPAPMGAPTASQAPMG